MLFFETRKLLQKFSISSIARQFSGHGDRGASYYIPSNDSNEVIAQEFGDKGLIVLNKPRALNALSLSIIENFLSVLQPWESSKNIVVVKGVGKDVFCAGGDVTEICHCRARNENLIPYYMTYLRLFSHIEAYKRPYVALISGIVMGTGVGISVPGKYRVATETTLFGMPENSIGLFPNAGCTYLFPRLNGNLGLYLGLTGHLLKGIDVKLAGFATHYVSSSKLPELTEALVAPGDVNVEEILARFDEKNPAAEFSLAKYSEQIDRCFGGDTIEEIIQRLNEDNSKWAQSVVATLNKMSPTSLKVTIEAFKRGKNMNFTKCLEMEMCLALNIILGKNSDFMEGVRALLIDKDHKPLWNPKTLEKVTDKYVEGLFNAHESKLHLESKL